MGGPCSASRRSTISIARSTPAQKERGAASSTRLLTVFSPVGWCVGRRVPQAVPAKPVRPGGDAASVVSLYCLQAFQRTPGTRDRAQSDDGLADEPVQEAERVDLSVWRRAPGDAAEPPRRRVAHRAQATDEPAAARERP